MHSYKKIERTIRSLKDRTDLKVSLKGETFVFEGLNSPYVSRRRCRIESGHGVAGLIVFGDDELFIAPKYFTFYPGGLTIRDLPAHLLPELQFPATYPSWVRGVVQVGYPDLFSGYDQDGKPLFGGGLRSLKEEAE